MEKYRNRYRIQSHRMPNWDYSDNGVYFITLVTQNRECNLGRIDPIDSVMQLSDFGEIVNEQWLQSFEIRNELFLDEYIIMPNHIHAIVVLDGGLNEITDGHGHVYVYVETHGRASLPIPIPSIPIPSTPIPSIPIQSIPSIPIPSIPIPSIPIPIPIPPISIPPIPIPPIHPIPPTPQRKPKSISSFVAGFKSAINSKIDDYIDEYGLNIPKYNRKNHFFQPNYHDHIIRNHGEYRRIKEYIINNPSKWNEDQLSK